MHTNRVHPIGPYYDARSAILILGTFPSLKSREQGFFYGHPQNRFWRVIAHITGSAVPESVNEKKVLLSNNHIALWDVIAACDIDGSSDASIKNVVPNDLSGICDSCDIRRIFLNGKTAERLYHRYIGDCHGIGAECLPSTSPANAGKTFEMLVSAWSVIGKYLNH